MNGAWHRTNPHPIHYEHVRLATSVPSEATRCPYAPTPTMRDPRQRLTSIHCEPLSRLALLTSKPEECSPLLCP